MDAFRPEDVCVVVPTLNEAHTIARVLEDCKPFCNTLLVIDGASTDGTADIARAAGAQVDIFAQRGKGSALIHALNIVQEPITVFIDADGSHDPADIPALVLPVQQGKAAMVVGSRWEGGSDELHGDMNKWLRRNGSRVLTALVNLRWLGQLTDIQNGFRALQTDVGKRIGLNSPDFTIEQEMVMKFMAGGFRVINVPSHEYARQGGIAKLNLGKVWFHFGVVVLRHVFNIELPKARRGRRFREKS